MNSPIEDWGFERNGWLDGATVAEDWGLREEISSEKIVRPRPSMALKCLGVFVYLLGFPLLFPGVTFLVDDTDWFQHPHPFSWMGYPLAFVYTIAYMGLMALGALIWIKGDERKK